MNGIYILRANLLYMYTEEQTSEAPITNCSVRWKSNKYIDATHEIIMAADVANPFRILSAYFTTTATKRPPNDCNEMAIHTTMS